jgi:hypothetical protein
LPPFLVLEGQASRYVDGQAWLIVLDDQNVVATTVDDLRTKVTLTEGSVAGKDAALDGHDAEQLQSRFVLVGLGVDAELGHDGLDVRGISGQEVDGGSLTIATAAEALTIEAQVGRLVRLEPGTNPAGDGRLERGNIKAAEDAGVGGLAEAAAASEAEEPEELPAALLTVIDDGFVRGHTSQHGDDSQSEQGWQGMSSPFGGARIVKALKQFHQGGVGFHA